MEKCTISLHDFAEMKKAMRKQKRTTEDWWNSARVLGGPSMDGIATLFVQLNREVSEKLQRMSTVPLLSTNSRNFRKRANFRSSIELVKSHKVQSKAAALVSRTLRQAFWSAVNESFKSFFNRQFLRLDIVSFNLSFVTKEMYEKFLANHGKIPWHGKGDGGSEN